MQPKFNLQDELEALKSIYEGDECFNIVDNTTLQYKVFMLLITQLYNIR